MKQRLLRNNIFRGTFYSFPFRLLLLNLKKNLLFILFWIILFGFVTKSIGAKYGIPYLFLDPEYLDRTNFLAYFIVGFSCGGFIMAYNISSYIMNSYRFPFLATLNNPFWKYCLNNFFIPVLFILIYSCEIAFFQKNEIHSVVEILFFLFAFLSGITCFLLLSFLYFFRTNKDIYKMFGVRSEEEIPKPSKRKMEAFKKMGVRNPNLVTESRDWYVETYLSSPFKIRLVRPVKHYKRTMIRAVFRQNHRNAMYFALTAIMSLLVLGLFRDVPVFEIPAGASLFLLFTMYLLLTSAMFYWFRGWAPTVVILLIIVLNYTYKFDVFDSKNKVFGMNYQIPPAEYSYDEFRKFQNDKATYDFDFNYNISILHNWKNKLTRFDTLLKSKPKIIFINTSGGGLRSSLWTFYVLQKTDEALNGKLLEQAHLISGSSGGMIGAAYLRELFLQKEQGKIKGYYSDSLLNNISRDILNPVSFSLAINDWFFPTQKVKINGVKYQKDRAFAFEQKIIENTGGILDKKLEDYKNPEALSNIPMMVFAPVIINDGRKLFISAQPCSYLVRNKETENITNLKLTDGIEFSKFFLKHGANNVRFTSVLRMNATFPYITPIAQLPSNPTIEVMDAGMRDNYGLEITLKYLFAFRKWIEQNTSGVVIIQIRDKNKENVIEKNGAEMLFTNFSKPMGALYENLFRTQDYNQNQLIQYLSEWLHTKVDIVDFHLKNEIPDNISLSWHLTQMEKQKVLNSLLLKENQESVKRLVELLK